MLCLLAVSFAFAMEYRKSQKRQAQKNLLTKRRDSVFIAEYVKRMDPGTYAKAQSFLEELRQHYPEKRDLTTTHEFLVHTTQYNSYGEYYNRKRRERVNKTNTTTTTTTTVVNTTTSSVNTMELNIPLLPENVVAENITVPLQVIPPQTLEDLIKEITTDPILQPIFDDLISTEVLETDESITGLSPLEKELMN